MKVKMLTALAIATTTLTSFAGLGIGDVDGDVK